MAGPCRTIRLRSCETGWASYPSEPLCSAEPSAPTFSLATKRRRKRTWWRALEIAQAADFVREKEDGLDAAGAAGRQEPFRGQRQRLTIARALVKRPQILNLDDSASALDYATEAALRKALRENGFGTTVFVVSQRSPPSKTPTPFSCWEDGPHGRLC